MTTAGIYNGNIIARAGRTSSTSQSYKKLSELCPNIEVGKTYTLSFKTTGTAVGATNIYIVSSKFLWKSGTSHKIVSEDLTGYVYFYSNYPETTVATISNFQIQEGTEVTEYTPYQYL